MCDVSVMDTNKTQSERIVQDIHINGCFGLRELEQYLTYATSQKLVFFIYRNGGFHDEDVMD